MQFAHLRIGMQPPWSESLPRQSNVRKCVPTAQLQRRIRGEAPLASSGGSPTLCAKGRSQ